MDKIICISSLIFGAFAAKIVKIHTLASTLKCSSFLPHEKCQGGPQERNFIKFYVDRFYENLFTIAILYQSVFGEITDNLRERPRVVCAKTERSESKSVVLFDEKNISKRRSCQK